MTDDERERAGPHEAFALLGHRIRLDILSAFFGDRSPIDPDSVSELRNRRARSYSELMAATGLEDSGKFNYHLQQLRGVYVERVDGKYVPTAGAIALHRAVVANRPTESVQDDLDVDEACPNCGAGLRGRYAQEHFTVECPACDLFTGLSYHLPKNGLAVRDGENVYGTVYARVMHDVGLARTGQCPSCAGVTSASLPRDRLDGDALPIAKLTCETCSWIATIDVVSALQFEPRVTSALLDLGVPIDTTDGLQATEQLLTDVIGRVRSEAPFRAVVRIDGDGAVADIVVDDGLDVHAVEVR